MILGNAAGFLSSSWVLSSGNCCSAHLTATSCLYLLLLPPLVLLSERFILPLLLFSLDNDDIDRLLALKARRCCSILSCISSSSIDLREELPLDATDVAEAMDDELSIFFFDGLSLFDEDNGCC